MTVWKDPLRHAGRMLATALLVAVAAGPVAAQPSVDSVPTLAVYGSGVHSFFAGQLARSYDDLTNAIEAGSSDPRVYYFRGLAALRMGRTDEAEADFTKGAELESDPEKVMVVDVARALERVQGPERMQLERHRTRARVVSQQQSRRARQKRYLDMEEAQDEVLREPQGGGDDIGREVENFGGKPMPDLKPAEDRVELPEPGNDRGAAGQVDDATERESPEPAAPAEPAAEDPVAEDPAAEPADEPAAKPGDELAEEMADEKPAGDAAAEDPAVDAGDADSDELPAERDAAPVMEEKDEGIGEGETFSE